MNNKAPWWKVHYTVSKGTYWEFENTDEVQAETHEEAVRLANEAHPLCYVWGVYRK